MRFQKQPRLATEPNRIFPLKCARYPKYHVVPAHHVAIEYIDDYLEAAGVGVVGDKKGPLFRSSVQGRRQDVLLRSSMTRQTRSR